MKNLVKSLNLDKNTRQVLLYRVWTIFAGIIIVFFVPQYLSSSEQGFYYTFLSIVALQYLFDLGLSQTITQIASHEFAHLDQLSPVDPAEKRLKKLAYIKYTMTRWYRWASGIFVAAILVIGSCYFSYFGSGFSTMWFWPWVLLVASTGIILLLSPRLAIVEGAGWTGRVASLRLAQSLLGHAVLVLVLISGGGLWSVAAVPAIAGIYTAIWLSRAQNPFRSLPLEPSDRNDHPPWRAELVGLQWRVAIAWLGGYFASQVIVPVIFAMRGPVDAGRVGLGLQIFAAVQALGMSWISARIPMFGQLISRGDQSALMSQFVRAALTAVIVSGAIASIAALMLVAIDVAGLSLASRLPSTVTLCVLVLTSALTTAIYAMAAYMRAHKEEPLVASSLAIGALTLAGTVLGALVSTDLAIVAYGAVTLFVNLPWTVLIFKRYFPLNKVSG